MFAKGDGRNCEKIVPMPFRRDNDQASFGMVLWTSMQREPTFSGIPHLWDIQTLPRLPESKSEGGLSKLSLNFEISFFDA